MDDEVFTAIVLEDNGGDPIIPPGAKVLCSQSVPLHDGDYVVIARKNTFPLLRLYTVRNDGSVLLKAMNRNADSYVTTAAGLKNTSCMVVLKSEYSFPAAKRAVMPQDGAIQASGEKKLSELLAPEPDGGLLTFEEAQAALKVKRTKMYALLRSGTLKASKLGKLWRIEKKAIHEYLESVKYKKD